jgi:predicted nucleic acid-binding protein
VVAGPSVGSPLRLRPSAFPHNEVHAHPRTSQRLDKSVERETLDASADEVADARLDAIPVLPFGLPEARRHAELWAELARTGTVIGPHDLLIAATALAQGHALVTLNQREFGRVPGLRLVATERYLS